MQQQLQHARPCARACLAGGAGRPARRQPLDAACRALPPAAVLGGKVYLDPVEQSVSAFAPATVANLGPGFDWMGCAVEVRGRRGGLRCTCRAGERHRGPQGCNGLCNQCTSGAVLLTSRPPRTATLTAAPLPRRARAMWSLPPCCATGRGRL